MKLPELALAAFARRLLSLWLALTVSLASVSATRASAQTASEPASVSPLAAARAGVLVAATDVFVDGIATQAGTTILSGSDVNTGPSAIAVIDLGPLGRIELRSGTAIRLTISPGAAQVKIMCDNAQVSVTRGEMSVVSPGARKLKAGERDGFDREAELFTRDGTDLIIDCGGRRAVYATFAPSAPIRPGFAGMIALVKIAATIAFGMAFGGADFIQPPPPAADPITP